MRNNAVVVIVASALAGSVAAFALWAPESQGIKTSRHNALALPLDVEDLVRVSSIIFEGTVVNTSFSGNQFFPIIIPTASPSTPGAGMPTPTSTPGGIAPPQGVSLDISTIQIYVDNVLFSRSPINLQQGSTVEMLMRGNASTYASPTPGDPDDWPDEARLVRSTTVMPQTGETRLFLLRSNPDGQTFGPTYGPYSILDISGSEVRIQSSPPIVIDISSDPSTQSFLAELQTEIANQ